MACVAPLLREITFKGKHESEIKINPTDTFDDGGVCWRIFYTIKPLDAASATLTSSKFGMSVATTTVEMLFEVANRSKHSVKFAIPCRASN